MLVVKYHKNLTIDAGVTVTATSVEDLTYKKGMYLCVMGELVNKGEISMTARGTYDQEGENVYLWENEDGSYEYVPAVGGTGGLGIAMSTGTKGTDGLSRQTGGGGSGGSSGTNAREGGDGGAGTSYSGGAGGGGTYHTSSKGTNEGSDGSSIGGAGGYGAVKGNNYKTYASGGAGNLAGKGAYSTKSATDNAETCAENGTGGLLIIYSDVFLNAGKITSNGSNVNGIRKNSTTRYAGGGASGGGSINIFTKNNQYSGNIQANGGVSTCKTTGITYARLGSNGGDGSVTKMELLPHLDYPVNSIILEKNQSYTIDKTKLKYINKDGLYPGNIKVGEIVFESLDKNTATVAKDGKIMAIKEGTTVIKITDKTNKISTCIYVEVQDGIKVNMDQGNNFTVAVKKNGTVWSYGLNDKGQLGIGTLEDSQEPVQVMGVNGQGYLENIKQVSAGYSHALALSTTGEVYAWGDNSNNQLGNGNTEEYLYPIKVEGLNNIIQVEAYKNISLALDSKGIVYLWGQDLSSMPMMLVSQSTFASVSGDILLSNDGLIYSILDTTNPINNLLNIAKISAGEDHYLALSAEGTVYSWGTNNEFGELGVPLATNAVTAVAMDIQNISAGNNISILQDYNGNIYVAGNNSDGQIGIGDIESVNDVKLVEGITNDIEFISAGEGTHSALIDKNGYVWHAGTNAYGECALEEPVKTYKINNKEIIKTNVETAFLDLKESVTITASLENTFNLKADVIDNDQSHFELINEASDKLSINDKTITALDYSSTIVKVKHKGSNNEKDIRIVVAMKMDSIVQGIRDTELVDGNYSIVVNNQEYPIELINIYDDTIYSEDIELGDKTEEYKMLVVKYHKNLTIKPGVKVTASTVDGLTYKKGMYLCVMGELINEGEISMTARGTYNCSGEDVYLWENTDGSYEYVPAVGGDGGLGVSGKVGNKGVNGENRQTGGGGSGGSGGTKPKAGGDGGSGTSYSGGAGGGGTYHTSATGIYRGTDGSSIGGEGGTGAVRTSKSSYSTYASGGAGNKAGKGAFTKTAGGNALGGFDTTCAEDGTGGLLILYADELYNNGTITSNGSNVNGVRVNNTTRYSGGGASGGGSINIFANIAYEQGTVSANGGQSTIKSKGLSYYSKGSDGGNGSYSTIELMPYLSYPEKEISIKLGDNYLIDASKLEYVKQNELQTGIITLGGNITYESLDTDIINVDTTGNITPVKKGVAKVKVTDVENNISTYIIVRVVSGVQAQIKQGTEFTVALKENGTVWTYGRNANGQLGNGTNTTSSAPVQVLTETGKLTNIVDIGAEELCVVAVNSSGEVYTWGRVYSGSSSTNNNIAKKVEGLSDIVKVESFANVFYAVSSDGNVYAWGKGYSDITHIETNEKIIDVQGNLILGEKGKVYLIDSPTQPIDYISNISSIAYASDHYLCTDISKGYVYAMLNGTSGQLGKGDYTSNTLTPTLIKTEEGYLKDIIDVSASTKISMVVTLDGEVYVCGDNASSKLGITETKTPYATQVQSLQDMDGNTIELTEMEIVEAGINHTSISDREGNVYSVGINKYGQLGTENTVNRTIYTKIGKEEIVVLPEKVKVVVGNTKDISIITTNSFNLKSDIADREYDVENKNEKIASITEIEGVDNSNVTDIDKFTPNFRVKGNKLGKSNVIITSENGLSKSIWINVVAHEDDIAVPKVVNGYNFTVALRADGTVWTFGTNEKGQLGLSDTTSRNKPVQVKTDENIIDISSGISHTLLLGESGTVYSFGLNNKGQLGTKNTTTYKAPKKTSVTGIVKVVAHENTSFAITTDGKVYAWGLGYSKTPKLLSIEQNVIDIDGDYYLATDGKVRQISDKQEIKLSLNEYDPSTEPEYVEESIVQISAGVDHLLMLGESGKVYSYGKNVYWQLGDGTTNARDKYISTVVKINENGKLEKVTEVSAGDRYSIAVTEDGFVYVWGINETYQIGYDNVVAEGGMQESKYAILKEDIRKIQGISAGYTHTTAYDINGDVYAWGQGLEGQLGNAENSNYYEAKLVGKNIIETNTNEILLEVEQTFNISSQVSYFNLFEEKQSHLSYRVLDGSIALIDQTGNLIALKEGRTTILVEDTLTGKIAVIRLRVLSKGTKPDNVDVLVEPQVETAGSHTITLKVDGTVWSYGQNTYGELGDNTTTHSDKPVQVKFQEGTIITKIATGENHSLALDSEGNVWAWGKNDFYQLGTKKGTYSSTPTKVAGLPKIIDITCGSYNSFAITEDEEVYAWGLNANGECGIGSYTSKITVTKAKYLTDAIDIRAGKNHTMVLRSTGEVYVTGSNLYGELGNGSTEIRKQYIFTKVDDLKNIVEIGAGNSNNIAVDNNGNVYTWGSNVYGELGINNGITYKMEVSKISSIKDIRYVDGGKNTSVLIDGSGNAYVAGLNKLGGLGNNSTSSVKKFEKLDDSLIKDVIDISSGSNYTVFLKSDGSVWGTGDYNQGDDTLKSQTKGLVPKLVGIDKTGFNNTEILLHVEEEKDVASDVGYKFNLIRLNDNFVDSLEYESLNEEIATVSDEGVIKGIKTGTTWVKATNSSDTYIIKVNVVEEGYDVSPKVKAGNNFATVLKANGNIWTFGYNSNGELADGTNITKDIPIQTNIIATYTDMSVGESFIVALRSDKTVWTSGDNTYGQLGVGDTISSNRLSQVNGVSDIVKVAA